jgi:hypothetical protein
MQLFSNANAEQRSSAFGQESWGVKESSTSLLSTGASPRSKVAKVNTQANNYQIMMHFVKSNLKLFLRLVSTDIHSNEV